MHRVVGGSAVVVKYVEYMKGCTYVAVSVYRMGWG